MNLSLAWALGHLQGTALSASVSATGSGQGRVGDITVFGLVIHPAAAEHWKEESGGYDSGHVAAVIRETLIPCITFIF